MYLVTFLITEVITEVAEQIGFSDFRVKQREAILAVLSEKTPDFCTVTKSFNRIKGIRQIQQNSSTFSVQETCCSV